MLVYVFTYICSYMDGIYATRMSNHMHDCHNSTCAISWTKTEQAKKNHVTYHWHNHTLMQCNFINTKEVYFCVYVTPSFMKRVAQTNKVVTCALVKIFTKRVDHALEEDAFELRRRCILGDSQVRQTVTMQNKRGQCVSML